MNLLAHAYLSPPEPGVLVGNLVADWVKGRARRALPEPLRAGMDLHRRIDAFTDTHPVVGRSAAMLSEKWGRYSPVLVDVFFDHILASGWLRYSDRSLAGFAQDVYSALAAHRHVLPERCHYAISAMTMDDWLTHYATLDGIRVALSRLSARLRHDVELAPAVDDLFRHRAAFQDAFDEFFPQLERCVATAVPIVDKLGA